eukprot:TRINITY_DN32361_c0_g1_i1.p1 TRINITY_DN32361_c0_g1~~TRINITY_DN32361_c0_g1_i1.p1  ORF type:complete len:717 (+),score=83.81 TRINITY_DN32361_c0_g1_i1:192-2342(+)
MALASGKVKAAGIALYRTMGRDGAVGFGNSLGFLFFLTIFNERVHIVRSGKKDGDQNGGDGMVQVMRAILSRTCTAREACTVMKLSSMLLLRTVGSVWVSRHWGAMVNSIVQRNFSKLKKLVIQFAGVSAGLALLNALLKYYIGLLKQQVRERITLWCHEKYMRPKAMIYYKANCVGDKVENLDHQVTSDVEKLSETFADVLSQSLKPIVDFVVYSVELSCTQGPTTPLTLYSWFAFASCVSTVTLPPFGELAATEQQLEGHFRGTHSDLIANCEQIAFLGAERPERQVLDKHFLKLLSHCNRSLDLSFNSYFVRQYLNKYFVTVIGLYLIARPLRLGLHGMRAWTPDQIAQYFTSSWRNMEAMATSIQDLFELSNRVGRLSGLASRVVKLMTALEDRPPVLVDQIEAAKKGPYPPRFVRGDILKFEHVSVYKPDGTLLVRDLNFSVKQKQRVLVTGANGCGKSSLFRVIRQLWPLVEGTITMPSEKDVYFLTQVNFVPLGTLRDIVTYPQSHDEMLKEGRTDEEIRNCLRWAHVSPEVTADGRSDLWFKDSGAIVRPRLDDIRDWQKDLSPGQKQRLAFARLFYHRPLFVVLDECTNGISPDVEHDLYDRCTKIGLAVFSISHKIELKLFHDYELHYVGDSEGSWKLSKCSETVGDVTHSSSLVTRVDEGINPEGSAAHAEREEIGDGEDTSPCAATITYQRQLRRTSSSARNHP